MLTKEQIENITCGCINSLDPSIRSGVRQWVSSMKERGVFPYIYFGFRSEEKQKELYEAYQKGEGSRASPPGESYHQYGAAFDWVPAKELSDLPGFYEANWDDDASYKIGEEIAPEFGLTKISKETGHLQDARYKTWRDAKSAYEQSLWPTA